MQDIYTVCNTPLFLADHTRHNNSRAIKTPIVKYPYLPLSKQIASILRVPGVEALLDEWCKKPRKMGEYTDIFDGNICRNKLQAPDGSLFFFRISCMRTTDLMVSSGLVSILGWIGTYFGLLDGT